MRMRRREFILALVMLADVGRASAQDRVRRVGALISEPGTGNWKIPTFSKRFSKRRGG